MPGEDTLAIREVIENWVLWRDAGDWERFATVWHDDGWMTATWFQGPARQFIDVSRAGFERGVNILADAVKVTLGPKGRYVVLDKKFGAPTITNDGVTIAREIEVEDVFENQGAQLVREVATSTNDVAGDGTTTATVLAQAIVRDGLKNVAAGANPMAIKRGIEKAVDSVVENLKSQSKEISGKEDIARVATGSAETPMPSCSD